MLVPSLHCAMRLRPGLVLIFQGIEPHRVMPLVPSLDPTEPLAPGYNADMRIVAILYPKRFILSGTRPKTLPEDARPPGQVPQTLANLFEDSRVLFGSRHQHSRWTAHEILHSLLRSAAVIAPQSHVDFVQLVAVVKLPRYTRRASLAVSAAPDNNVFDDDDRLYRRLGVEQPHRCSVACFCHPELLDDE
jgi:hypothetical protein